MFECTNVQHDDSNQTVENGRLPRNVVFPSARSRQDQKGKGWTMRISGGQLPRHFMFPSINAVSMGLNQTYCGPLQDDTNQKLTNDISQVLSFARRNFQNLDDHLLEQASCEALVIANSGLFDLKIYPDVFVDPYGEFTFSHKSSAGYVDIGVRGEKQLSYHVRNDFEPSQTKFDDHEWDYNSLPQPLFDAIKALKQHLQ